jgi:uncharacterized membrane protein
MPWKHWSAERLGIALAVLAALGFSFKAIFVKLAYAAAPVEAVTLLSLRMVFALPVFLWVGFVASRSAPPLTRRDGAMLVVLGLLGYYASSMLDFLGLQYISAGLERLILFTYPTLTVLIGVFFMGKALEKRQIGAVVLTYAGIGLAFAHDLQVAGDMKTVLVGAAFVFGSALTYAMYSAGDAGVDDGNADPFLRHATACRIRAAAADLRLRCRDGAVLHRAARVLAIRRHPPHRLGAGGADRHPGASADHLFRLVAAVGTDLGGAVGGRRAGASGGVAG